jgi:hypothetical protein
MVYKYTGRIAGVIFTAMASVWVAVVLYFSPFPVFPILGTSAVITVSSVLTSGLTATLLGPLWGTASGFTYGWLIPYVNPSASIGLLTFLSPTTGALVSGLVLFNKWKEATAVFAVEMAIWFSHPFAWYQAMPIITWEFWLAFIFIAVSPVRKWIVNSITTRNVSSLPLALWCLAWISRMGEVATGNNIGVWVNGWGVPSMYPFWAPLTVYYAIADSLTCVGGAIIGALVLLAAKAANTRILAVDCLEAKNEKMETPR